MDVWGEGGFVRGQFRGNISPFRLVAEFSRQNIFAQFSPKKWISNCSSKERHLLASVPVCFALSLYPPFDLCPLSFFAPPPPLSSPCIAVHESASLRVVPPSVWGTQSLRCLPSTVHPLHHALGSSPLFFQPNGGLQQCLFCQKTTFCRCSCNFPDGIFFG